MLTSVDIYSTYNNTVVSSNSVANWFQFLSVLKGNSHILHLKRLLLHLWYMWTFRNTYFYFQEPDLISYFQVVCNHIESVLYFLRPYWCKMSNATSHRIKTESKMHLMREHLKQHLENWHFVGCDAVSERNPAVCNTDPRSVTICQMKCTYKSRHFITMSCPEKVCM